MDQKSYSHYYGAHNSQIKAVSARARKLDTAKFIIGDLNTSIWSVDYKVLESGTEHFNASKGFGDYPYVAYELIAYDGPH